METNDKKTLINTVIASVLTLIITSLASFVWVLNNDVQLIKSNQSLLITPNGDIRPSVDVEVLKAEFKRLHDRVDKLECK
jgi:hypothetical protein